MSKSQTKAEIIIERNLAQNQAAVFEKSVEELTAIIRDLPDGNVVLNLRDSLYAVEQANESLRNSNDNLLAEREQLLVTLNEQEDELATYRAAFRAEETIRTETNAAPMRRSPKLVPVKLDGTHMIVGTSVYTLDKEVTRSANGKLVGLMAGIKLNADADGNLYLPEARVQAIQRQYVAV